MQTINDKLSNDKLFIFLLLTPACLVYSFPNLLAYNVNITKRYLEGYRRFFGRHTY